ncbi:putative Signal recognition particle 54 kDa protein [Blattamonas nauphoetae]|uniref:signal-recognition-particle GTPase n=1 Tax=Blattamonas nauphoetae TaxID=2049346 RepID=A0ABQ9Y6I4_9EUKA|nr:putative Signal recognition particle 54 kDa protein [Blattamonas nauphoetae]
MSMLVDLGKGIVDAFGKLGTNLILDDKTIDAVIRDVTMALLKADVNASYVQKLRDEVKSQLDPKKIAEGANKRDLVRQAIIQSLIKLVDPGIPPFQPKKGKTNVVMFVGLQGSGKTTTVAKYARYYQRKGFKPALICADTFRAGAFEQLQQNATKIKVPFWGKKDETDPLVIAETGVNFMKQEKFDLIIVDTSGRHKQSADLLNEMEQVANTIKPDDIVLVMDSSIGQSAYDQAAAFRSKVKIGSVIITKLDGHAKGGGALAAVAATNSPITFLGDGEGFDALRVFNPSSFISTLIGAGDINALVDKIEGLNITKKAPDMITNLVGDKFCMKDMRSMFEMFEDIGPVSQMMEMIPGGMGRMYENLRQQTGGGSDEDVAGRMRKFVTILDSMTPKELAMTKPLPPERYPRLARGSGQPLGMVEYLMQSFKLFAKMGQQMKQIMPSGLSAEEMMKYNPLQNKNKLDPRQQAAIAKMMPPGTLQQMGGMSGFENLMRKMADVEKQKGKGG